MICCAVGICEITDELEEISVPRRTRRPEIGDTFSAIAWALAKPICLTSRNRRGR
jgi:hypothetical protein